MGRKTINIPMGTRFGKLVAIEEIGTIKTHSYIKCKCDCGNTYDVIKSHLISGHTTSCGHPQDGAQQWKMVDAIGTVSFSISGEIFLLDGDDFYKYKNCPAHIKKYNNGDKYLRIKYNGKWDVFHRLIMNAKASQLVDHINNDTMDNRKSNLRFVTRQQNAFNHKVFINNTSGVSGICFDKKNNRWYAQIMHSYHNNFLGYFDTKDQAIIARKQAEEQYFGEYRYE